LEHTLSSIDPAHNGSKNTSSNPGNSPAQSYRLVGTAELLVQAVQAFKSGQPLNLALVGLGVFLPQILATWLMAPSAASAAFSMWKVALGVESTAIIDASTLPAFISQVSDFYILFMAINIVLWVIFLISYLALVYQSLHHMRPWAFPRLTGRELLSDMIRVALKRGILLTALVASLGFATQAFPLTSLFLGALALMAPVVMVAEHKSALRSLINSLTLRYARQVPLGGWAAFLSLVTIGGLFFSLEFSLEWLAGESFKWLANVMPPALSAEVPGMPFTVGFILVDTLQTLVTTVLVSLLPGTTAALYMQVHFRNSRRDLSILA
jgi:hypothetical protein